MLLSVQYLRALAALMVVILHADIHYRKIGPAHDFTSIGAAGVDIFFVISGFIIHYISYGLRAEDAPSFLQKRFVRVIPLYWIYTTIYISGALLFPQAFSKSLDLVHIIKSYLFIPAFHPTETIIAPVLLPGWTLNYEMFFYTCFAALFSLQRFRVATLCLAFGCLVVLHGLVPSNSAAQQVYTSPLLIEFLCGIMIAEFYRRTIPVRVDVCAALIVTGIAIFAFSPVSTEPIDNIVRAFCWGGAASALMFGLIGIERNVGMRNIPILKLMGDSSYSLYLSHILTVATAAKLWKAAHLDSMPAALYFFFVITLAVASGVLSFWYIETPTLIWLHKKLKLDLTRRPNSKTKEL